MSRLPALVFGSAGGELAMTVREDRVGAHLLLEGWHAPAAVLDDPLRVRIALHATVVVANLTLRRLVLESFEPQGITAVALLAESHLAIHTWPERGLFAADLFHCGTLPAAEVVRELTARLEASSWNLRVVERVVPVDLPRLAPALAGAGSNGRERRERDPR